MLLNVGLTIAAGVILWFATEQFGYQRKNRYLFAFFMGMKNREILWTGFAWTQMVFILSCVILGGEMNLVYLVFLLLLDSGTVPAVSGHPASSGGSGQCSAFVSGTAGRFSHEGLSEDDQV